jgi:MFS family permease
LQSSSALPDPSDHRTADPSSRTHADERALRRIVDNLDMDAGSGRGTLRFAAMVAAVCGGLYGYDTGIISGALLSMTDEFSLSHRMQEIVTAAILAGAVIGALATSWLSERVGRKVTVLIVSAVFAVGAIACSLAPTVPLLVAGRLLLGVAVGVAFFTQCGGLEMMIYYAPTFLSDAGFGRSSALFASLGVAIVYAIVTLLGCLFVDRIGRRRLMLIMIPGSVISLIGLGAMFATGATHGSAAWLTIVFLLAFMFFNSGGIQVCGWLLGSEMFPLAMRGPATALHAAMLWGSNLIVTGTALSLVQAVGLGNTMWIYAGINLASFLFVLLFVPETAGASLEEIEESLRQGRFFPRKGNTAIAATANA